MIGYYVFESGQIGANPSPGKIMISAIEDLRDLCIMTLEVFPYGC